MSKNKIIFIMGVSGSGKSTIMSKILDNVDNFVYVPSYTTRDMRVGESDGNPYYFISRQEFDRGIFEGEFLEYATVHGMNYYGTKTFDLLENISQGKNVIKEIEIEGLELIKKTGKLNGRFITIFADISDEVMISRITARAPISQQELENRLESAAKERNYAYQNCDKVIDTNRDINLVLDEIIAYIDSVTL